MLTGFLKGRPLFIWLIFILIGYFSQCNGHSTQKSFHVIWWRRWVAAASSSYMQGVRSMCLLTRARNALRKASLLTNAFKIRKSAPKIYTYIQYMYIAHANPGNFFKASSAAASFAGLGSKYRKFTSCKRNNVKTQVQIVERTLLPKMLKCALKRIEGYQKGLTVLIPSHALAPPSSLRLYYVIHMSRHNNNMYCNMYVS